MKVGKYMMLIKVLPKAFINIIDGYDVPVSLDNSPPYFKSIFFPTDSIYNAKTAAKQAPYTIGLQVFYNPANWEERYCT